MCASLAVSCKKHVPRCIRDVSVHGTLLALCTVHPAGLRQHARTSCSISVKPCSCTCLPAALSACTACMDSWRHILHTADRHPSSAALEDWLSCMSQQVHTSNADVGDLHGCRHIMLCDTAHSSQLRTCVDLGGGLGITGISLCCACCLQCTFGNRGCVAVIHACCLWADCCCCVSIVGLASVNVLG